VKHIFDENGKQLFTTAETLLC